MEKVLFTKVNHNLIGGRGQKTNLSIINNNIDITEEHFHWYNTLI